MTAERLEPSRPWVGCVLRVEVGVLIVLTDEGAVRATLDGRMLGAVARDRSALPESGDWVILRRWPDRNVTVVRTIRSTPPRLAQVVPLRG